MRTLLLLRHAKAMPPVGADDFNRPLAERGRQAAGRLGAYLKANSLIPDKVMVSSARRTRETFGLVQETGGLPDATFHDELYLAPVAALRQVPRTIHQRTKSLMIIAHNPGLQDLVQRLADREESDLQAVQRARIKFPTCSLAVFTILTPWPEMEPGDGALRAFVTPADIGGVDEE